MRIESLVRAILLTPIMPGLQSFSKEVKREVRREQHDCCAETGIESRKLEIHHKLPQTYGGSDKITNAVGLLGERDRFDIHEKYDRLALDEGIMFDGRPICDATPDMIKCRPKWEKACKKFHQRP